MSMNPNWPKWIAASVAVYFKAVADAIPLKIIVEGVDERESEKMEVDHVELRINGPYVYENSKDYFRLDVDTNVLFTDLMGGESDNPYNLHTWAGLFQEAAQKPIPVYRYGPDTSGVDDGTFVGCLTPRGRNKDASKLFNFGQISVNDRVRQMAVDTRHWMHLSSE